MGYEAQIAGVGDNFAGQNGEEPHRARPQTTLRQRSRHTTGQHPRTHRFIWHVFTLCERRRHRQPGDDARGSGRDGYHRRFGFLRPRAVRQPSWFPVLTGALHTPSRSCANPARTSILVRWRRCGIRRSLAPEKLPKTLSAAGGRVVLHWRAPGKSQTPIRYTGPEHLALGDPHLHAAQQGGRNLRALRPGWNSSPTATSLARRIPIVARDRSFYRGGRSERDKTAACGESGKTGPVRCAPRLARVFMPASIDELADRVATYGRAGRHIRAVGSDHSFTPLVQTDDVLMSLDRMQGVTSTDETAETATVLGGTRLQRLGNELYARGVAQANLGDIDEQSIAGAISTSTHGTGVGFGSIATQVAGLTLLPRRVRSSSARRSNAPRSSRRRGSRSACWVSSPPSRCGRARQPVASANAQRTTEQSPGTPGKSINAITPTSSSIGSPTRTVARRNP